MFTQLFEISSEKMCCVGKKSGQKADFKCQNYCVLFFKYTVVLLDVFFIVSKLLVVMFLDNANKCVQSAGCYVMLKQPLKCSRIKKTVLTYNYIRKNLQVCVEA